MARILILGAAGMAGSMTYHYLKNQTSHEVWATVQAAEMSGFSGVDRVRQFTVNEDKAALRAVLHTMRPDYIINCIGIIKPYCREATPTTVQRTVLINTLFPLELAAAANSIGARVIQIATDCVFSGREGKYDELAVHDPTDLYGKTKSLGEVLASHVLHIRCSIIGPEQRYFVSLLEWFLQQPEASIVPGYSHHRWNGVTTLQFAECCHQIIDAGPAHFDWLRSQSPVHHFTPNQDVTKCELLQMMARVFNKRVQIQTTTSIGEPIDRTLRSRYRLLYPGEPRAMEEALYALRLYWSQSHVPWKTYSVRTTTDARAT